MLFGVYNKVQRFAGFDWKKTLHSYSDSSRQQCPVHVPEYQSVLGQKWQSPAKVSGLTTACKITMFFSYLNRCRIQIYRLACFFENNGTLAVIVATACLC